MKKNKKNFLFICGFEDIDNQYKTEVLLYLRELYKKCNEKERRVFDLIVDGYNNSEIRKMAKIDGYVYKNILKKFKKFLETGVYG